MCHPAHVRRYKIQIAGCQLGPPDREVPIDADGVAATGSAVEHEPWMHGCAREHLPAESLGTRVEQHDGGHRELQDEVRDDDRPDKPVPGRPARRRRRAPQT